MRFAYLLMLVLGFSLLLGCAAKKAGGNDSAVSNKTYAPGNASQNGTMVPPPENGSDKGLADLFDIDTTKPLSDEGLDTETPEGNASD